MSEYHRACHAADIPLKKMRRIEVNGRDIVICHTTEGFFAVENRCSHALATLHDGRLRACRIMCPLHGATFDVRSGDPSGPPAFAPIQTFALREVDGVIEVQIPSSE